MDLKKTEKLMKSKFENNDFDSYAVSVHYGHEERTIFSNNVHEYTYFDIASMGKVLITSTLILQTVSKGLLKLEDTLSDFLTMYLKKKRILRLNSF